jgi:hypothetical protein
VKQFAAFILPVVRHAWVRLASGLLSVALLLSLVSAGYSDWKKEITAANYCPVVPAGWPQNQFRYIQLYIDNERLREPIFEGRYVVNLGTDFGHEYHLRITQAGSENYASTTFVPTFIWSDNLQNLMMPNNKEEMAFLSRSSSHYWFPFDSAHFHEAFIFDPAIDIRAILLKNLVAGFYMPCDKVTGETKPGSAEISFELNRNPLIVDAAVLLLLVAAGFAVLITLFMDGGPLPHALSSYFFAVWTIRTLFGLTAEGFPTFFDLCLISLVLLIILLLFLRSLGLRELLIPVGRSGRHLVRRLEGRELVTEGAADIRVRPV